MRQALLAVVLIAASFVGGAFVNGPGLRWVQTNILAKLGMEGDGDTTSGLTDTPLTIGDSDPVAENDSPGKSATSTRDPATAAVSKTKAAAAKDVKPNRFVESKLPKAPEPSVKGDASSPAKTARSQTKSDVLKPTDPSALPDLDPPTPLPSPLVTADDEPDTSVALATLGDASKEGPLDAANHDDPKPSAAVDPDLLNVPESPTTWVEVRRTLKSLGVTRYGTEGDTSGRVRFFCLIPVAGKKAVGQHFEAEGPDELTAAQTAIRRVVLWRAAEAAD